MARTVKITCGKIYLTAELDDSPTAQAIWKALPLRGRANRWGDEIYFTIPLELPAEKGARQDMEMGELGYWPQGPAFCIFFGPTPVSAGDKPRAYSPVNPFGRVLGDATALRAVADGEPVVVERA
jgi:hypothetical protein